MCPSKALNQSGQDAHVEQSLIHAMNEYNVPGVSIAIIHQHSIIWARAYGVLQEGAELEADKVG